MTEIRKLKKEWLSSKFSTSLEKTRWVRKDRYKQSLTYIPIHLMEKILTYLDDNDLHRAKSTCHFFHRAFFQYFKGTKIEKGKVKTIMNYVNLGYSFKSIENMALKHSFHIFEQKLLQNKNFPSLRTLKLENIKLEGLGEHKRLLDLTLGSCEYDWSEDTNKNQGGFPFPNLQVLRIENGTPIMQKNNLPYLDKLKTLEIIDTFIDQPLSKNKFKNLRKLVLIGEDVVKKIPNIRISRLWDLTIDNAAYYPIKRENQFKFLRRLKLVITGDANPYETPILKRLTHRYCPYLEDLILEFGTEWTNCDFSFLESHNNLRRLELHSRGIAYAKNLSSAKFPNMTVLILNCDVFEIDKMPPHDKLEHIEVPKGTDISRLSLENSKWPKLVRAGEYGLLNPNDVMI